jgi:hypothetical protein
MHYISILSTLLAFIFAAAIFTRYSHKKPKHLLFWGIGMLFFGLGTLSEVILSFSFSSLWLKLWYFSGAMMTAAWLGQGTVFLLVRKPGIAMGLSYALIVLSVIAFILLAIAPMTADPNSYVTSKPATEQYKNFMSREQSPIYIPILILTILLNIYGTVTLVGGAIYSAYIFWRKRIFFHRMLGNILIAAGGMILAMAGSFVRLGWVDWLYLSELIGVIFIFAGYLEATFVKERANKLKSTASPGRV